ncbi:hypothetical protein KSP39_PZI017078 [Platanthera zijinensis]|uniref:Uncharacterized protein n=1 Tax=Platanthera zijinensis TaxID=2320716 RepID=A0AAP0B8B1_9ASPA
MPSTFSSSGDFIFLFWSSTLPPFCLHTMKLTCAPFFSGVMIPTSSNLSSPATALTFTSSNDKIKRTIRAKVFAELDAFWREAWSSRTWIADLEKDVKRAAALTSEVPQLKGLRGEAASGSRPWSLPKEAGAPYEARVREDVRALHAFGA